MSEEVKNFIDKMAQNDMVGAGDAFKDALRAKVGDQLDVKRLPVHGSPNSAYRCTQVGALVLSMGWVRRQDNLKEI